VVFGHTFFSSFTTLELNEAISNFEFDVNNISYFAETALEVLLTCMFRKTTNIDLVRLDSRKVNTQSSNTNKEHKNGKA